MHYCHSKVYDLAVFAPAHSCCESCCGGPCHVSGDIDNTNHCEDESIVVESTDDYIGSSYAVSLENAHSIDLFLIASILFNLQGQNNDVLIEPPWHKEPPPYQEVVLSHIQSYLI